MSQPIHLRPRSISQKHRLYGTALGSVAVALVVMLLLDPIADMTSTPFLMFFGAIVVSGWWAGVESGLLATGLSALISNYFFMAPLHSFHLEAAPAIRLMVFIGEGVTISLLCGSLRMTHQKMDRSYLRLRESEESLRHANQWITGILEGITDGFFILDSQWRLIYVNQQAQQVLGKSRDDLRGHALQEILPSMAGTLLGQKLQQAIDTKQAIVFEASDVFSSKRWFEIHITPLEDGLAVYFQDLTQRKNDERQLLQHMHAHEILLAERDCALAQERYARNEAEAANRSKDEFLAILSHELRTPLNPILGWTALLRSRELDELTRDRALETIERNARLQTQLIEDLLDVSRVLRGKLLLNVESVDLIQTVTDALDTMWLSANAKAITLHTNFNPHIQTIQGDRYRLQQIIWNLLSNAVKFTPIGGSVTIQLTEENHCAIIRVNDTGLGISQEFLPHVFERFRQADSSTTRSFGGLGLGLAIVRYLTELHGGTVQVESPGENQGATFTVSLPMPLAKYEYPQHWVVKPSELPVN